MMAFFIRSLNIVFLTLALYFAFIQSDKDKYTYVADAYDVNIERTVTQDEGCCPRNTISISYNYRDKYGFEHSNTEKYYPDDMRYQEKYNYLVNEHKVMDYNEWNSAGVWFLIFFLYLVFFQLMLFGLISETYYYKDDWYNAMRYSIIFYRFHPNSDGFMYKDLLMFFGYEQD